MRTSTLIFAVLSAQWIWAVGCGLAPPDILEVNVPSDTSDRTGPYLVSAQTWGSINRAYAEWRDEAAEPASLTEIKMFKVRSDSWEGRLPGSVLDKAILLRIVVEGPGGRDTFPSTGYHRFVIGSFAAGCNPVCDSGFICVDNLCQASESCDSADDCGPDLQCRDGQCVQIDLCDPVCASAERCVNAQCIPDDLCGPCDADLQCRLDTGECVDCLLDRDCEDGLVCETGTNQCVDCVTDEDCLPNESCIDSECRLPLCGLDDYEPNNGLSELTQIDALGPVEGTLCPTDLDYFSISDDIDEPVLSLNDASGPIELTELDAGQGQTIRTITLQPGAELVLSSPSFFLGTTAESVAYRFDVKDRTIICEEDVLEPDNGPDSATTIGASGARIAARLCPGNGDWYEIRQRRRDREGSLLLKTALPSIEADVSRANNGLIDRIAFGRDTGTPWVSFDYPDIDDNLFVELNLPGVARDGGQYWIATRPATGTTCNDDQFEPDDSPDDAFELPAQGNLVGQERVVCGQSEDWFSLPKAESESITFSIEFDGARGDIDLLVYDGDLNLVGFDLNGANNHSVELPNRFNAGVYKVRVILFGQGQNDYVYRVERR
ncbi:MAG: hypothetical protein VYA30_12205 [Myxococcota bacterium]|nr:hypothetical protein [Myxococcota bacterium]